MSTRFGGTWCPHADTGRRVGFTLIEVLFVVAIIGILGGFAGVSFVSWRSDSLHREVTVLVERAILDTREQSRRQSLDLRLVIDENDPSALVRETVGGTVVTQRTWQLPQGAVVSAIPNDSEDAASPAFTAVGFDGLIGTQEPFAVVRWEVTSGSGRLARTSEINVVPPLAITAARIR